jgi:hypothetical protein
MEVYIFILVDAYSKWVEVFITQLTAQMAIAKLMEVFAKFGLVDVLIVSVGGPAFIAERFKELMFTNSFKHIISPSGQLATNGQAENTIETVKPSIKAAILERTANSANPNVNEIVLNHLLNHRSRGSGGLDYFGLHQGIRPSTVRLINHKRKQREHQKEKRYAEFKMNQDVLVSDDSSQNCTNCKKIEAQTNLFQLRKSSRVIKRHIVKNYVTPTGSQSADDSIESDSDVEKEVIDVSFDESQYMDVSGTIVGKENEGFEAPVPLESYLEN